MRVPPSGPPDQPVHRSGRFRWQHVELGALLHAAKDEIDAHAAPAGDALVVRPAVVFLLDPALYWVVRWINTSFVIGAMPGT